MLQIDEQLFASFAPRRLKRALSKSAELVVTSLPTFYGLDFSPVLKVIAAVTMVGCLIGTVLFPQNSLLDDAKSTLCGTRRGPSSVRGDRRSVPFPYRFGVRRRAGQLGVG